MTAKIVNGGYLGILQVGKRASHPRVVPAFGVPINMAL